MLLFELEVVRFPPGVEEDIIEDEVAWPVDFEGVVSKEEDGDEFVTAAIRVTDRTTVKAIFGCSLFHFLWYCGMPRGPRPDR